MTRMEAWYLECLRIWCAQKGRAPVIHELAAMCKRSRTAVHSALVSLEHKGYVKRDEDRRFVVAA